MTQINLLPWREESRQAKRKRFGYILLSFIVLTLFIVFIIHMYVNAIIDHQEARNNYLQTELDQQATDLTALNKMKKQQSTILSELHFVVALREESYRVVRLLDGLVRVVPEGVTLTKVIRTNQHITLIGKAQSDVQITLFMKNLASSSTFKQPVLTEISSKEATGGEGTYFVLKVEQQDK